MNDIIEILKTGGVIAVVIGIVIHVLKYRRLKKLQEIRNIYATVQLDKKKIADEVASLSRDDLLKRAREIAIRRRNGPGGS